MDFVYFWLVFAQLRLDVDMKSWIDEQRLDKQVLHDAVHLAKVLGEIDWLVGESFDKPFLLIELNKHLSKFSKDW